MTTQQDRLNGLVGSLAIKAPCRVRAAANIVLSGLQTIDGVVLAAGDYVLVGGQTDTTQNGIWVADTGDWERRADFDGAYDVTEGTIVMVLHGTTYSNTYWRLTTTGTVIFGTSSITFAAALASDAALLTFLQAGTGAVARTAQSKMREAVSVTDFGVTLDGLNSAANLVAFQAAIDYCSNNLKTLLLPGTDVSQTIAVAGTLSVTKPLCMIGAGSRNVTIQGVGLAPGQILLDVDGTAYGTYEQGEFSGFTLLPGAGADCMRVKNVSNSIFHDIGIRTCRHGITYTGTRSFSNVFSKITAITAVTGNTIKMVTHTGGGQHSFRECSLGGDTGFVLSTDTLTDSVSFFNTNFENCVTNSVFVGGQVAGLSFYGSRTEGCGGTDFLIQPSAGAVTGLVVSGTMFSASNAGGSPRITLGGGAGKVRGFSVMGNSVGHGGHAFASYLVNLNGDGESGTIADNYLDGLIAACAPVNTHRQNVYVYNNEGNNGKFAPQAYTEEGLFDVTDSSGAALGVLGTGYYTRTGRVVTWQALFTYPVTASGAAAQISGPPYTYADDGGKGRAGNYISGSTSPAVGLLRIGANFKIYKAAMVAAVNSDLSAFDIYAGGSYITTAA